MNDRNVVRTEKAPAAIGPYSQAVIAAGLVHCSGQVALDPGTGVLVGGDDVAAQTERVLLNLSAVLNAAGTSLGRVVSCTVYLQRMSDFAAMNEVYGRHLSGEQPPARATVEVARLPKDALVEISCVALA